MFKWPGGPSPRAPEHELADYAELVCWEQGHTSATALIRDLDRLDENDYSDGVLEEEETPKYVEDAYLEIERRMRACGRGYPFDLGRNGDTLYTNASINNRRSAIYKYLLLATRLNMSRNNFHAGLNGTRLLEELAAETSQEYFGHRAESLVFGAVAGAPSFQARVNALCCKIGEGDGYIDRANTRSSVQDGKLDIVVWKHFSDELAGKLIAFGQCKTGTNYKETLTQLQPDSFCKKWIQSPLAMTPVRMFFLAEALPQGRWYDYASDTGVLFDRCRIVDFSHRVSKYTWEKVEDWTAAAAKSTGLQYP